MIELQQFLLWILRKIAASPRRWHNWLTDLYEYSDWFVPVLLIMMGIGIAGVAFGVIADLMFNATVAGGVCLATWFSGLAFIVSTGIRAMYRAFKAEQQDFINTLKQ